MNRIVFSGTETDKRVSLHNHSSFSDGQDSAEAMCRAAKASGFRVFGLSEHWVIHPEDEPDAKTFRMEPGKLDSYIETMLRLRKELEDDRFSLKIGLELDFFFDNIQTELRRLEAFPLDYLIGSVHYAGCFPIDRDASDWTGLPAERIDAICREYFRNLLGAAHCGAFSILGHLDLPKKYGFMHPEDWMPEILPVLSAAAESGMALDVNTGGFYNICAEPYPSPAVLREARKRGIPAVLGADSHSKDHIARGFDPASAMLREAGYTVKE